MAYKFGQFRKEQYPYSNYVKQLDKNAYTLISVPSSSESFPGITFNDIAVRKSFSTADGNLLIRVVLNRFDRETDVTVKLVKENTSSLSTTNVQTVAKLKVPSTAIDNSPVVYDLVVSPNDNYAHLVFSINRDGQDFQAEPREWIPTVTFMISSFGTISNIIPTLDIENAGRLRQIGIQGRPGLEMCINGEMIRVGRSGIYEINHGIDINFIGFIPDEDDHFFMDYQY